MGRVCRSLQALTFVGSALAGTTAFAQQPPAAQQPPPQAPPPPGYYYPPPYGYPAYPPADRPAANAEPSKPPPAREGFQMHFGMGLMFPWGDATGAPGDTLGARYAWQVPFEVGLGAKVTQAIYVGGYFGFSFGAEGSDRRVEAACDDGDSNFSNDVECNTLTVRLGLEGRYYLSPAEKVDPWLGYGIGFEAAYQTLNDRVRRRKESTTASGWEFARLAFGIDFRTGRVLGIGPALTVGVGRFTHTRTTVNNAEVFDGGIDDPAYHAWVTLLARGVVFP